MKPLHTYIPEHCPFKVQTELIHVIFTHSLQVFLPLPLFFSPTTSTFLQADTQSSPLLRSTCPNHLNLPPLTTSAMLWTVTPKRMYKTSLCSLSFRDIPHIHLTIIRSALSRICKFSALIAHVLVPYVNPLWTHALKIFPFTWCDVPRAVRGGDSSWNLAQYMTL